MMRRVKIWAALIGLSGLGYIGLVSFFQPKSGVDICIRNDTDEDVIVNIEMSRGDGSNTETLELHLRGKRSPIETNDSVRKIDCPVDHLNFDISLYTIDRAPLDTLSGSWPGEAGISNGAGSNRILVELYIGRTEKGVDISFQGLL